MASGRRSTFASVSTLVALSIVCGSGACAKSRQRVSEPDTDVDAPIDGGSRQEPTASGEPDARIAGPIGAPVDAGGEHDDPLPPDPLDAGPRRDDPPPPPIEVKPPPVVVHERAAGAAVLDIDPDEPRSWFDRILCEKMVQCRFSGVELLTQQECEALMGGPCASYGQVPEDIVEPECIETVDDASCDDLPLAFMTPACVESVTRVMAMFAGITERRAEGETCDSAAFCASGLTCQDQSGDCGVCRPYARLGDDCTDRYCVGGYCDLDTLLCTPYARPGEPCNWKGNCFGGCAADGLCQRFFPPAQPAPFYTGCTGDAACGGAECRDGYCLSPLPLGAACERDSQCVFGRCHEGVCATSASCELPGEGEYCTRLGMCQPPLGCDSGRCVSFGTDELLPKDAYCVHPAQCDTGYCQNGVCTLRPAGLNCQSGEECISGRCIFGLCGPEPMPMPLCGTEF